MTDVIDTALSLEGLTAASVEQLCSGEGPHGSPAAKHLASEVMRRRTWALHRHVHLVRAFEEALVEGGIATALSIGCGAGLSELFLAARHPEIEFTLTDFDESRLAIGRQRAHDLSITNVSFGSLDLLADVGDDRYDWVSSIEVLEHIEDDGLAARNMLALSDRWFWVLVPHCEPWELVDPDRIRRAWDRCEHHRPGYTFDTLTDVIGPMADVRWMRTCYLEPSASELRQGMRAISDEALLAVRTELIGEACADLEGPFDAPGSGIEVLGRVRRPGC
ncbi:MAG: class I SAM-dependent methyltransferase [Acidimicrobiales bacterium]